MGEVYEATHERLALRYAVKFLQAGTRENPEALPRFMREAQITSRLRHPGIVSVVDFNTLPSGVAYLVMEYLEGESLGQVLARTGPMPLARVVDITDQLSAALAAAHLQGVVHRDMHPQNVFVVPGTGGQTERMKVLDFGISKFAAVSQKITGTAAVIGTPQYMSPEQAEGKTDELDAASDQFSLAAIVYELLTGRPAFSGETLASVAYQVVHGQPDPIQKYRPELPVEIESVVARGLAKNKQDRFPSVSEFAVHLRWTATLPGNEVSPKPGAALTNDVEETTAVSALPSGMAAVLRKSNVELASRTDDEPTVLSDGIGMSDVAGMATTGDGGPRRGRGRIIAAIAGGVLVVALAVGLAARSRKPQADGASAEPAIAPAPAAPAATAPAPSPAHEPSAAPRAPGPEAETPPSAEAVEAVEDRKPLRRARPQSGGSDTVPAVIDEAATKTEGAPSECRLTVGSYPWSELWVDGADIGQHTPVVALPIACGPHRLEFKRRDLKIDQVENVMLNAGHEFKRQYELQGASLDD
jgi:tRNA A-37 threonylcarbamoyl transferase component Bud32